MIQLLHYIFKRKEVRILSRISIDNIILKNQSFSNTIFNNKIKSKKLLMT